MITSRGAPAMAGMTGTMNMVQPQARAAVAQGAGDDFVMVDADDARESFEPRNATQGFDVISHWDAFPPHITINPKDLQGLHFNGVRGTEHQLEPIQQFGKILHLALLTPQTAMMDPAFPANFHKLIERLKGAAEKLPVGTPAFRDQLIKELTHNFMGEFTSEAQKSDFQERIHDAFATQRPFTQQHQALFEGLEQAIHSYPGHVGESGKALRLASEKIAGSTFNALKGLLDGNFKSMQGLLKKQFDALQGAKIDPALHSAVTYKAFELAFAEFSEADGARLVALNNHPDFQAAMASADAQTEKQYFAMEDALLNLGARSSNGEFNGVLFLRDYLRLHPSAQVEGTLPPEFSDDILASHDVIDRADYA
jgi:hypothetical protein